jgi:phenylalanine-4-hydroxylase
MKLQTYRKWTPEEKQTWKMLFERQATLRDEQIYYKFSEGIKKLGLVAEDTPDLDKVNEILASLTGFHGIAVEGLEEGDSFYPALARKEFPIGNFIRDAKDINYTPAPDIFHDLYGHLPFLADKDYANFSNRLGLLASKYSKDPEKFKQCERMYWFGVEFSLIKTPKGNRIFGAGIASSFGECAYALSDKAEVLPFSVDRVRAQDFRIDDFQRRIFILENEQQLYGCLEEFEEKLGIPYVETPIKPA